MGKVITLKFVLYQCFCGNSFVTKTDKTSSAVTSHQIKNVDTGVPIWAHSNVSARYRCLPNIRGRGSKLIMIFVHVKIFITDERVNSNGNIITMADGGSHYRYVKKTCPAHKFRTRYEAPNVTNGNFFNSSIIR